MRPLHPQHPRLHDQKPAIGGAADGEWGRLTRRLLSSDDIGRAELTDLLARAAELQAGAAPFGPAKNCALLFLEPSLRTRVGFAAAARRLGWPTPVEVVERRSSETSMAESVTDTLSVLSAYFDALVVRLDKPIAGVLPFIGDGVSLVNGGDRGRNAQSTQLRP